MSVDFDKKADDAASPDADVGASRTCRLLHT
jgi:hypothetical protein